MKIIVEIPEGELSEAVQAWRDGGSYTLEVTQDKMGEFTLNDAVEAEAPAAEEAAPAAEAGAEAPSMPMKNPALANVIKKGRTAPAAAA